MKRYSFLTNDDIYEALNRLRDAFLAAKDGVEVEEVINAILTTDERIRIGRRIIISEYLLEGLTADEIVNMLQVGKTTIMSVSKSIETHEKGFNLIKNRQKQVEKVYKKKNIRLEGASEKIIKSKVYTGFKRKAVKR